jgi:hypothetical protein
VLARRVGERRDLIERLAADGLVQVDAEGNASLAE